MAFGVTNQGFILKRFEDIKASIEQGLRDEFGEITTDANSVFGQIIGVLAKTESDIWEQLENIYNSQYPHTSEGVNLDNASSLTGVVRLTATPSTAVVQMRGVQGTSVPLATEFSQSLTGRIFTTQEVADIDVAKSHQAIVEITTVVPSTVYTITINGTAVTYTSSSLATAEEIASLIAANINSNPVVGLVVTAVHNGTDDFLTITIKDKSSASIFDISVDGNETILEFWSPVSVASDDLGLITVPVSSIDTIETPVAGLSEVKNIADGVTGRALENDADFRIRRRLSLSVIAAGTLSAIQARLVQDLEFVSKSFVFENRTDIWSGRGINTVVYDIDFVTSNIIAFSLNGNAISPVAFTTDHDTTMNALKAAVEGLPGVNKVELTDIGGDNRTLKITTEIFNSSLYRTDKAVTVVTGGASQAVAVIVVSNEGRPPHSIEAIVAALDTPTNLQEVADKIFELKAAGIQAFGNVQQTVTDPNGDEQLVGFSFSVTKYVHVELTYDKTNSDFVFPLDGEDQIEGEVLRLGDSLTFGSDLLIQQFEGAGYVVVGVTNTIVRLAVTTTPAPIAPGDSAWKTTNIKISASDLPSFDSTRVYLIDGTP